MTEHSKVTWLRRWATVVWLSVCIVAHGADSPRSVDMYVGVVKTTDVCPSSYSESSCKVDRTAEEHSRLLDSLLRKPIFHKLTLTQEMDTLPLPSKIINALQFATGPGEKTRSAVFIFDLGGDFNRITFNRKTSDGECRAEGEDLHSVRRWYYHCDALSIAPSNRIGWEVILDGFAVEFTFTGPSDPGGKK